MFTGIVEEIGKIKSFENSKLIVECKKVLEGTQIGDSISVNGCCQTVVFMDENTFVCNVSSETLRITKGFKAGNFVNLERALTLSSRLGGHIVQGHIDGVGKFLGNMKFEIPKGLEKYIIYKGSVTIDGVSLTVSNVDKNIFSVAIIPHTLENTCFKFLKNGDSVNIETDILGRYVEKFLSTKNNNITQNFLEENGFI